MSWWKPRSHLQSADSQYSSSDDVTPGGVVNRSPPRRTRGKKASSDDYPSYAAADTNRDGGYNGGGYGSGYNDGYGGGAPYGSGNRGVTIYGGGGYNNPPAYGNVSDGYNAPGSWGAQDTTGRTPPMFINTREVHVWAPPNYEGDDQRRRGGAGGGGGGGFFRPALEAVGHFVDRRFGLDDRN